MKKRNGNSIRRYIILDALLNMAALAGAAVVIGITDRYMPFAGFGSLFLLVVLIPYFLAASAVVALLLLYLRRDKPAFFLTACILQVIIPVPWLALSDALGSKGSWFEMLLILQIMAGILGLLLKISGGK